MANAGIVGYIDPFCDVVISYDGKFFGNNLNKKSIIGSRVSYSDVLLHSFKVPSTMGDDELKTHTEIKMYDDAGLDLQKQYKITYSKKELEFEENVLVEAFAIEIDKITESLGRVLKQAGHIDFLALPFLTFSTLYKNKIIEPKNDLFVYINDDEAFLSIYKDGKYLSTKSLASLNETVRKLNSVGVDVSLAELKENLSTKGLDASKYERGDVALFTEIESMFATMLTKINDVVVYNRSVFGFEKIDRLFFNIQNTRLRGVREFIHNFGFSDVEVLDFNLLKGEDKSKPFEKIVASYIYDKTESNDFLHNLTIFQKEPPFYKKESGKVIITALLIVLLSFAYTGLVWYENSELKNQQALLQVQYDAMKKSEARYKAKISAVNKELQSVLDKKNTLDKKRQNIVESVTRLENLVSLKSGYSSFILSVNKLLKKHNLSTIGLSVIGKNSMSIEIVAEYKRRDSISEFMEDLIAAGFIGINTDEIKYDKDIYISKVEIKR